MDFLPNCSQKFPIIPNNKSKFRIKCSLCSQIISHHLLDLYPSLSKRYLAFCSVLEPVLNYLRFSSQLFPKVPNCSQSGKLILHKMLIAKSHNFSSPIQACLRDIQPYAVLCHSYMMSSFSIEGLQLGALLPSCKKKIFCSGMQRTAYVDGWFRTNTKTVSPPKLRNLNCFLQSLTKNFPLLLAPVSYCFHIIYLGIFE